MKIAFLIQAYHNHDIVKRFVDMIHPAGDVFIHIDAKVNAEKFHTILGSTVRYVRNRKKVSWGGRSQIDACMELLQMASANCDYDYYSIHSDTDYPSRPLSDYTAFLELHEGWNFIETIPIPENNISRYQNINLDEMFSNLKYSKNQQRIYRVAQNVASVLPSREPFNGWEMRKGIAYFTLYKDLAKSMLEFWNNNSRVRRYFTFVNVAEEHFYSSFAVNCGFKETISPYGCLRYHDWTGRSGGFPSFLTKEHYEEIIVSGAFFARKFNAASTTLMDALNGR